MNSPLLCSHRVAPQMIMVDYDEDIFGDILAQLDDGLDDTLDTNDGNLSIFRLSTVTMLSL